MILHHFDGPTLTLVVNPAAGMGKAKRELPKVCRALLSGLPGANLRVFQSTDYAEARLRCIAAVEQARPSVDGVRPDSLIVMGGDGMMHLGLNACAGSDVPLGMIPAGTGNDFIRGVEVPSTIAAATKTIIEGHIRSMDLMRVQGDLADGAEQRWVGSVLSTGFDARVNKKTNSMTWPKGSLRYAVATLAVLAQFEPLRYRLKIDGHPRSQDAMFIAVGNAGYFGGGMRVCPQYKVNDGLLDITVVNPVSRATLLRLLPAMYDGSFISDPAVELIKARRVDIDGDGLFGMADGEYIGKVPFSAEAVADALRIYVPTKTALAISDRAS